MRAISLFNFFHRRTLAEVKAEWAKEHYPSLSQSGVDSYENSYKKCKRFYDTPLVKIKYKEWQSIINQIHDKGLHYSSQKKFRNLVGQICKYAIKNEYATTNYAPMLVLDKNIPVYVKTPYTPEEIQLLWDNIDVPNVDKILMLIYTGVRISEFLRIDVKNDCFLDKRYFIVRKSKTLAGCNRPVPIHRYVAKFFYNYAHAGGQFLIMNNESKMSYTAFHSRYMAALRLLGIKHTIHECRHTCATLLDNAGANESCTRKILGHAGNGVTTQVYVHKRIDDLINAMDLID